MTRINLTDMHRDRAFLLQAQTDAELSRARLFAVVCEAHELCAWPRRRLWREAVRTWMLGIPRSELMTKDFDNRLKAAISRALELGAHSYELRPQLLEAMNDVADVLALLDEPSVRYE